MSLVKPSPRMTVDQFLEWSGSWRDGERYELINGETVAMSPETAAHVRVKSNAWLALRNAVRRAGAPCEVFGVGMTVRIDDTTAFEPDAVMHCTGTLPDTAIVVPAPILVVEVVSASTRNVDTGAKLQAYFRVPSVSHYLVLLTERSAVIHYRRDADRIETRILGEGQVTLDPPGITVDIADLYADS